jgi:NAD(P)H-dependent FMN reductase
MQPDNRVNVLALSGSLRTGSINSAFCRIVARLAPPSISVTVFAGLGDLPLFNPDLETSPPDSVRLFRAAILQADALLIASPEYAHGISGVTKNALDWLVSFEGVVNKPIALINTSPRARHAYDALREVLHTMSTDIIEDASRSIPLLGISVTEEAMLNDPEIRKAAQYILQAVNTHLAGFNEPRPSFPVD